jgi:hypothetical protein
MRVYHGSYTEITEIDLSKGQANRYHEETHQICFCTRKSLQMIELLQKTPTVKCVMISEPIIEALIAEFHLNTENAADKFFTSKIFTALADKSTGLYLKPWQDIYEMLKKEL